MSLSAETLSQCWLSIQGKLFSYLQEELGELSKKQRQLVSILELIGIDNFITVIRGWPGRPEKDRRAIARAFVAKAVYNMGTTRQLLERLESDTNLRRLCGWERKNDVPSEATFSRAFAGFSESKLVEEVHRALIEKYETPRLVGHISRDSTEIEARERVRKKVKKEKLPKRKRGRPKKGEVRTKPVTRLERQQKMTLEEMIKELPTLCDSGSKMNSKGYPEYWAGYKLHLDVADGQIPISAVLTSASLHDSQVAIPLATMSTQRVTYLYELMDCAYEAGHILEDSRSKGHVAIVDRPIRAGKVRQLDPAEKARYRERTMVERVNARLKDEFGGRTIRVRGASKIMAHLMFGILALTVDQILKLAP